MFVYKISEQKKIYISSALSKKPSLSYGKLQLSFYCFKGFIYTVKHSDLKTFRNVFPKRVPSSVRTSSCSVRASVLRLVLNRSCSEDGGSSPAALPVLLSPVFRRDQPSAPGKTPRS